MPTFRSDYKCKPVYVRDLKTRRSGIVSPHAKRATCFFLATGIENRVGRLF